MKSASAEAQHEIGKCCADLGRAGFLDQVRAFDGELRQRRSPKMLVLIFTTVSINQNVIFT